MSAGNPKFKKGMKKVVGSGRKEGVKNKKTIKKEDAYEAHQQAILRELSLLRNSQFWIAKGTNIVLARSWVKDSKGKMKREGKFIRITDQKEIEEMIAGENEEGETYHIIATQDPNPKALEDLMNRVFGKAKEQVEVELKGKVIILDS